MPTPARQSIALSRRGREAARRRRTHDLKLESLEPRLALATGLLSTLVSVVRDDNSQSLLAAGATAKITEGQELGAHVRLTRRPDSAIVVSFQSRAPLEVGTADWYFPTVAAASNTLRFTRANWNTPQSVSFAALQDGVRDGDHLVPVRMTATIAAEPHKQATRRLMIKSLDSRVITPTKPVTDTYKGSIVGGENSGSVQGTYDSVLERGTVTLNVTMPQLDKVRDRAITVGYSVGLDSRVIIESLQGITASRFRWNVTYRQVGADRGLFGTFTVRQPILGRSATATMTAAAVALPPKPYVLTTHLDLVPKRGRLPSNAVVYGLLAPNHGTFQSGDHIHGAPRRLSTLKLLDKGNTRTVRPFVKDVTRIEHTLFGHTVVDTLRYSGVGEELIVAGDAQKGHKLTLLNANSSTRFGIATSSPETLAVTLANAHEEVLRLRLDRAGGTADEATINYAGLVNDIASLDIVTSGKNHTDINATSNVRFVKVTGSGRNFLTFSDDGFGRQSIASSGLVIDGSTVTGDSTYFVGSYYSSDLILKGAEALGVRTYLGLGILGNQQLGTLSNVQGLVIQKGSSGILDMNSSKDIRFLELQTSATRPGELHAVATLIDTAVLQSIQYVGGGDSGSQRFPGIRITGPASLPGPSDRLDINYTNRGTPLLPSSGVEMADPILLDGAEQVRLDLGDSIGQDGYLSLPEVGGEGMKSLTIVNPSHGFSDLGLVSTGGQAGSLDEFNASGVQGPFAVRFDTASLAAEVKMVTADSNAKIVIDSQQASNVIAIDFGNGDNRLDTALPTAQFKVHAGNGNNILNLGSGRNIIGVGNGSNRISLGDGDDTIRFGAGANLITSGFGSDIFFIGQENSGNLDGLTQIVVADAGVSDDQIHYRFNGSSNQVASLTGSQSVAEFQQKVMDLIADPDVAASGPGAYYEVVANPSGPMTLIFQNTGNMSRNVILTVSGSHSPALSDNVLSIGSISDFMHER